MLTAVVPLATNNFGDTRSGGLAGPMGLFLIILLSVATVLLIRNMNSRLRRLPDRFPGQDVGVPAGSGVVDPTVSGLRQEAVSKKSAPGTSSTAHQPGEPPSQA